MFPIGKKETILLDFIGSLGKLEWLHYQSRIEDEWINDHFEKIDRSKYPPYTSFRFEKEVPEVITLLEDAIQSYKGKVEWCMTHHPKEYGTGVNHRILPTFVKNLRASEGMEVVNEYIENHYPNFSQSPMKILLDWLNMFNQFSKMLDMTHEFSLYSL